MKQRARMAQGHSVVHIYKNHLEKIEIVVPDYEEQKKQAMLLENIETTIHLLKEKKHLLQKQKIGLMQQLLTGKTRII